MERANSKASRSRYVWQKIVKEIYGIRFHTKFPKSMFKGLTIRFPKAGQVRRKT
jgi:hypothetical protein